MQNNFLTCSLLSFKGISFLNKYSISEKQLAMKDL